MIETEIKRHFYFSPTTPIKSSEEERMFLRKQRENTEDFCTAWQNYSNIKVENDKKGYKKEA